MIHPCRTLVLLGLLWSQLSCTSQQKVSQSIPSSPTEQGISRGGTDQTPVDKDGQAVMPVSQAPEPQAEVVVPVPEQPPAKAVIDSAKPEKVEVNVPTPLAAKPATSMRFSAEVSQVDSLIFRLFGEGVAVVPGSIHANLPLESGAFAYFEDTLGIREGILMTNGSVQHAMGPNLIKTSSHSLKTPGDPDLQRMVGNRVTYDACVLEFDVIPAGDTLAFNFVFGSEEYDEWVGSKYNDVFAFFIEGPGIEGKQNMALLPDRKTFVAINTVNGKPQAGVNRAFFVSNNQNQNPQIGYDGYTRVLKIRQPVQVDSVYHLKLAITDVSDRRIDSGLFLEGRSITSYSAVYQLQYAVGQHGLSKKARTQLAEILKELKVGGSKARLEIVGHADSQGEDSLNLILSEKRARMVARYFEQRGVDASHIRQAAWGEARPIANNETEEGRAQNRRVEILVIGQKWSEDQP